MKNSIKKLVMATTAIGFAFILGSTVQVKAESGDITSASAQTVDGSASMNYINKDVYKISLPTDAVLENTLTYQVDPQGLVKDTSAAQFGGITIDGSADGLYFKNMDASGTTPIGLSNKSDNFVITNKSSSGVTLDIEAKLVPNGTNDYSGGYATKKDFSASGDTEKGIYLGIIATSWLDEMPLSASATPVSSVAISAAEKYEVTYSGSAYHYDLVDGASGFPTFEFTLEGALNHDVPENTWMSKDSSGTVTTFNMPHVQLKYTPELIKDAKDAKVTLINDTFYISKATATSEDGGFGTTKASKIEVNGREIPSIAENELGYVPVSWDSIMKAYNKTGKDDPSIDKARETLIFENPIAFDVTWGGTTYYVEYGK